MITIDNDRSWVGLIQQKPNQAEVADGKSANNDGFIKNSSENQLVDLLALVKNSPQMSIQNERLNQLRMEINSDTYSIDLDSLVENVLVSDYGQ